MKVFLTGASGFLGGEIARQLAAEGHALVCLVRKTSKLDGLESVTFDRAEGDLADRDALARGMQGVDAVVHAAGNVGARLRDGEVSHAVNVEGTRNVLEAAKRAGVRRVVHVSSAVSIGATDTPTVLDEGATWDLGGTGYHYLDTKRQGEEVALGYASPSLEVVVTNPGTMFGPGDGYITSTRFVLEYVRGRMRLAPRGGLPLCDVRDVARGHALALAKGRSGERYILAGHNRTYLELLDVLASLSGLPRAKPLPDWLAAVGAHASAAVSHVFTHPFEDVNPATVAYARKFCFLDSGKAAQALGYQPRPIEESLRDTLKDFLARGLIAASTPELSKLMESAS